MSQDETFVCFSRKVAGVSKVSAAHAIECAQAHLPIDHETASFVVYLVSGDYVIDAELSQIRPAQNRAITVRWRSSGIFQKSKPKPPTREEILEALRWFSKASARCDGAEYLRATDNANKIIKREEASK